MVLSFPIHPPVVAAHDLDKTVTSTFLTSCSEQVPISVTLSLSLHFCSFEWHQIQTVWF